MKLKIIRREDQPDGQFNGGAVLEKRPVFYDGEHTFPYSNLFYWAHAWSEKGSTIGLHPHQGFEILSFILKGEIEHYDTKNKTWNKLREGDVQIIRSGSGISHAEKLKENSSIFQVWFDPDLNKSIREPASYDDYISEAFPVKKENDVDVKTFIGAGSPLHMNTEGIVVKELKLQPGKHNLEIPADKVWSVFVQEGSMNVGEEKLDAEDFFIVSETQSFSIDALTSLKLFIIESPLKPSYQTYIEMRA